MVSKQHRNANRAGKNSELRFHDLLIEANLPAIHEVRLDYGESKPDERVVGLEELKFDSKHRARFAFHTLLEEEIEEKYCKKEGTEPIMYSHSKHRKIGYVTIRDTFFVKLLKLYYSDRTKKNE